jgi:hypothetical protein
MGARPGSPCRATCRQRRPWPGLPVGTAVQFKYQPLTKTGEGNWSHVGRDDVHGILKYLLSRATLSLYLNMFEYDDEELSPPRTRSATPRVASATGGRLRRVDELERGRRGDVRREGAARWAGLQGAEQHPEEHRARGWYP